MPAAEARSVRDDEPPHNSCTAGEIGWLRSPAWNRVRNIGCCCGRDAVFNSVPVVALTGVTVRETVPDSVLDRADEIELVDLPPDDLLQRLREGKVYMPEQAGRALESFFRKGNLIALRELALRRTAERVDDQMVDYMRQHAIAGPWPAGERIMVCVSAAPEAQQLVRAGRRMADIMGARWSAVYVEMPKHHRLSEAARERIAAALRLAEHLGGEAVVLPGRDLPGELLHFARRQNITQIILGKSRGGRLRGAGSSVCQRLLGRNALCDPGT